MFRFHFGNQSTEGNRFRGLDIAEMGLGIFGGSKVERGRELGPFLRF